MIQKLFKQGYTLEVLVGKEKFGFAGLEPLVALEMASYDSKMWLDFFDWMEYNEHPFDVNLREQLKKYEPSYKVYIIPRIGFIEWLINLLKR